jgi:hypothetical protein
MVNTVPQVGRIAIVQLNSTTMAYAQGYSINESVSVIKEFVLEPSGTPSTGWPAVSAAGQKQGTIDIDELYVDNAVETLFEAMAPVTVICGPVGSSGGNPKDTYTGIISKVSVTVKLSAITIKKISIDITAAPVHSTW